MKYLLRNGNLNLAILIAITFLLIYLTDRFILTAGFYENNGTLLSGFAGRENHIYEALQKWVYFTSATYLLIKISLISLIIHTALYLRHQEIAFRKIFDMVVLAEFIFIIPAAIKLITFGYTFDNGTLLDWHKYYVLSALSLFGEAPADWYYALQSLNFFEFAYWFVLAFGITKITVCNFDDALTTVVTSYVPALAIWVISVTFCTLLMFPATG